MFILWEWPSILCERKPTKLLWFIFEFSFHLSLHIEICVKDFSVGFWNLLYCERELILPLISFFFPIFKYQKEDQPSPADHSLYLSTFHSLQSNFLSQISRLLWEPESLNFVYILTVAKFMYIVYGKRKAKRCNIFLPSFSIFQFSICHSNVILREICVKISQELLCLGFWNLVQMLGMTSCIVWKRTNLPLFHFSFQFSNIKHFHHYFLRNWEAYKLKLDTHMDSGLMYCVYWNQAAGAYSFLFFFNFLSPIPKHKIFVTLFCGTVRPSKLKLDIHMGNGLKSHLIPYHFYMTKIFFFRFKEWALPMFDGIYKHSRLKRLFWLKILAYTIIFA